mmetsp:Transcript_22014/g.47860  ORF Transcript_22014/g.47860 Transcript_22014/m.47860 type:complete len:257 (-) Transcript_22014:158-928(-)|eukprot:CAMPEP_0172308916 /NCGR_PEP_ID=MMETSP1058-20130122/9368_1 /TAXON_ID=83371 /ORGANISM="Detonula confervacea, Strain CCMP 353" /LENGTH=256 /DNA_ID=CAMNT_0013021443 /DNA_START=267 /DNA_END=1037 /DNA_ORIENTATION=+
MTFPNKDSDSNRRRRRSCHVASLCAAVLLSSSATSAFAPTAPATKKSSLVPRSAVIQKYRVENEASDVAQPKQQQSDAFSFLPSRMSSIQRMDDPSQFQAQVLEEENSLVVVRFYAEVCPSCRATRPLFRKWSRDVQDNDNQPNAIVDASIWSSQQETLPIKILEMPLNQKTSTFLKDEIHVDRLPYCHLYHPKFGLVEEQLVMNKMEFKEFVNAVDCWSIGGCEADLDSPFLSNWNKNDEIEFESQDDEDCENFC